MIAIVCFPPLVSAGDVLPRAEVDRIVSPAIDDSWAMGMVVGLINARDREVVGYGTRSGADKAPPDGESVFETGSISKTFTATLLADASERKEVALSDPVQKFLPAGVTMPRGASGAEVTLLHLTTHASGLPRMPSNFFPADPANPYADYTPQKMYDYLNAMKQLPREPGERDAYSNLGVGLLGHALALRAGTEYETLLINRLCKPLGMQSTRVTLDAPMRSRLVPGHDPDGNVLKNWDLPTFAGAGGIRSTADDMLRYLAAELGQTKTDCAAAIAMTHERRRAFDAGNDIGMGWFIQKPLGYLWHNGATGGYHAFAAFHPQKQVGVVVLCNTAGEFADAVGVRLMRRLLGEPVDPLTYRHAVRLEAATLARYVGAYKFGGISWMTIKLEGDHLTARVTGQPTARIYPESETKFFWKVVDAQVTFEANATGSVTRLVLHQNGADHAAEKSK